MLKEMRVVEMKERIEEDGEGEREDGERAKLMGICTSRCCYL